MDAVPAELIEALASDAVAKSRYEAMSPSHRREYAEYVSEAKKPETRVRRAAKCLEMIRAKSSSADRT